MLRSDRPNRLLIINIYYAPEETGIAPYNTGLSAHLVANGWDVTMLTGMPHFPQWRTWPSYRSALRSSEVSHGVKIRRVRHSTLQPHAVVGRALYEGTFLLQALSTRIAPRPDGVLAVIPNLSAGVAGALHARRFGVPFGVLVQDLTGEATTQSGLPGGPVATAPVQALEGWTLRQASQVGIISEAFRAPVERAGAPPGSITCLPNWSHVAEPSFNGREQRRRGLGWPDDAYVVLHAGNMGSKQYLENVLDVARLAANQQRQLLFVLMGDGSQRPRLEAAAGSMTNVEFLGLRPADVFVDTLNAADILLVNERATVQSMSLPSKITSYFRAGRPVVAAVPTAGSTADELARSGGALLVPPEDPAALLDGIMRVLSTPELHSDLVAKGTSYVDNHLDRGTLLRRAERFVTEMLMDGVPG